MNSAVTSSAYSPLKSINEDSRTTSDVGLNYFNYFTEVEEEFVRRRGKPMLISPMDWALVESWKNAGIPLHIVLRAINEAFDAYDARAQKYRKVNSVFYCQQAVEAAFAEYRLAQVGGSGAVNAQPPEDERSTRVATEREPFPRELIKEFLARSVGELSLAGSEAASAGRVQLSDAIHRALARLNEITDEIEGSSRVDAQALERDLDAIDRMILESATSACGEEEQKRIRAEAHVQLRSYRKKMDKAIYEQTLKNFVSRRMREMNNIPRLSLFYL